MAQPFERLIDVYVGRCTRADAEFARPRAAVWGRPARGVPVEVGI